MLSTEGKSLGGRTLPLHFPEEEGPGAAALLRCTGCPSPGEWAWLWYVVATFRVGRALPRDCRERLDPVAWSMGKCGGEGDASGSLWSSLSRATVESIAPVAGE